MENNKMVYQEHKKRFCLTDPPMAVLANYQLCNIVQKIIQKDVVPTYAFGIHYVPGGGIKPHRDRPQNELSMTLSLDVTPTGARTTFGAGENQDETLIELEINDALFYRGCEVTHFRRPVPDGYTVDQMIFGFRTVDVSHCYCS